MAGVDVRTLQRIEAGELSVGFTILDKFCEVLDCEWNTVTEGTRDHRDGTQAASIEILPT